MRGQTKLLLLTAVFVTVLTASTFVAGKLAVVLGLIFSVGGISYALTFPCVDVVTEVYGRRVGVKFVLVGLVAHALSLGVMWMALAIPGGTFWQAERGAAFEQTFGLVWRLVGGGVLAYLIGQLINVWVFEIVREGTRGRHLWLRSVASTGVGQLVDTAIFVPVAFAGTLAATRDILFLGLGQFVIKMAIAVIAAALVYAGVAWFAEVKRPTRVGAAWDLEVRSVRVRERALEGVEAPGS